MLLWLTIDNYIIENLCELFKVGRDFDNFVCFLTLAQVIND